MDEFELINNIGYFTNFELKLANDVYWIPYNTKPNFELPINTITKLVTATPEEKREKINTVIDAVNLFILSDFKETSDNIYIEENGILWEHHKPGKFSVLTNEGCCASCCTWANYLLSNNFDESGYISLIRSMKSGHIVNYFRKKDWYLILDLQPFVKPYRDSICPQTGKRIDFIKSKFITGVLVKAKSIEAYIQFYSKYTSKIVPEHLYLKQNSENIQPIGSNQSNAGRHIFLPNSPNLSIINQSKSLDIITYEFVNYPNHIPEWD